MFSALLVSSAENTVSSRNRLSPLSRSRLSLFGISALLAFVFSACSGGSDPAIVGDSPTSQPRGTLQVEPASFTLSEGGTISFRAKLGSQAVGASQLTWSVSPSSVATIDAHGLLTAVRHGEAVVTARYSSLEAKAQGTIRAIPRAIEAVSATSLSGIVGRALADSLAVQAVASDGTPVPGVEVTFEVLSGSGTLSHLARATGSDGVARVDWTMGTVPGQQQVRARANQLGELTFGAEVAPDYASASVEILAGDGQMAQVVTFLPEPLIVQVVDRFGNILPGLAVDWKFSHGGGSNGASGSPGSVSPMVTTTTDALGQTKAIWKLGTEAGDQEALCAPASGLSGVSGIGVGNGPGGAPPSWATAKGFKAKASPAGPDRVEVTPEESSTVVEATQQLSAVVLDKHGNVIEGGSLTWSTDQSGVVAVDNKGMVYALTQGKGEVFAEDSGSKVKGSAWVHVEARVVKALSRSAGDGQKGVVGTRLPNPVAVEVVDQVGSPVSGVTVTWSTTASASSISGSSGSPAPSTGGPESAATTTNADGIAQTSWTLGSNAGSQTLQASVSGVSPVTFKAEAAPGPVASIEVTPGSVGLEPGEIRQLAATARDEFGNLVAGLSLSWSSANAAVAKVSSAGVVSAVAGGSTEIRASSGGVTGSSWVSVSAKVASALQRTGGHGQTGTVGKPLPEPVVVRVLDNTGTPMEGVPVSWTVTSGGSFVAGNGSSPAHSAGSTTSSVTLTNADGTSQTTWTLGTNSGEQSLEASVEGVSPVVIAAKANPGPVSSVAVTPASAAMEAGESQQFSATAEDSFGNLVPGATLTWSSSNTGVAAVSGDGLAYGVAVGSAEIRATADGVQGQAGLTVSDAAPPPTDPPPGTVTDLTTTGTSETSVTLRWTQVDDGTGNPANYAVRYGTPTISWGSAHSTEVTVEGTTTSGSIGYTFTGLEPGTDYQFRLVSYRGTLNVDATFGGFSNIAGATTDSGGQEPTVASIEVTPASWAMEVGDSRQFSATAKDEHGNTVTGATFTWSSSNTSVAKVTPAGLASGVAVGSAQIRATSGRVSGSAQLTVEANDTSPQVASVTISPSAVTLEALDEKAQLTAVAEDSSGNAVSGVTIAWSTLNSSVATVDQMGMVTAKAVGLALIVASACSCDVADTVQVQVTQVPTEVMISPSSRTLAEGESYQFTGVVKDAVGYVIPGLELTWSSENASIAAVDESGTVKGLDGGTTQIAGVYGSLGDVAAVEVTVATTPPYDGNSLYPNEPAGLDLIAYSSMDRIFPWPGQGFDGPDPLGRWWDYGSTVNSNLTVVADASAPISPNHLRIRYPEGQRPGTAPVNFGGWGSASGYLDHLYFSHTFRLVDSGTGDWESQGVGTKLGFFGAGTGPDGAANDLYPFLSGGTQTAFTVTFKQQNVVSRSMSQNVKTGAVVFVGQWHHFELEMILNDIGSANGVFRWWVDGELIMEYLDVVYRTSAKPYGFRAWKGNPTWGGTGGPDKSRDDFLDLSDIRVSGKLLQ